MPEIEELAKRRADLTGQPYMEWLNALSEGRALQAEAHMSEHAFLALVEASAAPRTFAMLAESLDAHAKEHPEAPDGFKLLTEHADASPYGLSDWVAALEYLYDWLAQAGRVSPGLQALLEYTGCCVEAASAAPAGYPLAGIVEEMLDRYGIDTE